MQVSRIDGALLRITTGTTRADPSLGLSVGQRVSARVVAVGDGTAQLDVSGRHVQARTAVPLAAGQVIQLQVTSLGAEIALRLLAGGGTVSEQQFALAALATAHHSKPVSPATDLAALLRMLEDSAVGPTHGDMHARIGRLLGGLRAGTDVAALATHLRDVLENSGLLFESRVRAWLAGQPSSGSSPPAALPPDVAADLKVLLGVLGRALGLPLGPGASPADTAGSPRGQVADTRPQQARQWLGGGPPVSAAGTSSDTTALLGLRDAVLARQVETAYHWLRDGTLAMELPLVFSGAAVTARLRFRRGQGDEGDGAGSRPRAEPGFFLDFAVEPPALGPVRAQAHLLGSRLAVRLLVAEPQVAALVTEGLPALREALRRGGIATVRTDVIVDEAKARLEPLPAPALPHGGSVLDARA